jgi:hypothetical protein
MRASRLAALLVLGIAVPGIDLRARDAGTPAPNPAMEAARATGAGSTLKERLSDKASDEQRVDNCKVPVDRRGSKPRPDGCGGPSRAPAAVPRGS